MFYLGSVNETTGEVQVAGALDHNAATVIILTMTVSDKNATEEFPNQNDTGKHFLLEGRRALSLEYDPWLKF